jgi:glutamyl/glutaminyl-tRNA synthetase
MRMSADEIYPQLVPFLGEQVRPLDILRIPIELNKMRARTLRELAELLQPFVIADDAIEYEPEAVKKHLKGDELAARLAELRETLSVTEPFDVVTTEQALRALAESRGISAAKLIHPLRLALTGRGASPPVFDVAIALGRDATLRRIQRLIDRLPQLVA